MRPDRTQPKRARLGGEAAPVTRCAGQAAPDGPRRGGPRAVRAEIDSAAGRSREAPAGAPRHRGISCPADPGRPDRRRGPRDTALNRPLLGASIVFDRAMPISGPAAPTRRDIFSSVREGKDRRLPPEPHPRRLMGTCPIFIPRGHRYRSCDGDPSPLRDAVRIPSTHLQNCDVEIPTSHQRREITVDLLYFLGDYRAFLRHLLGFRWRDHPEVYRV